MRINACSRAVVAMVAFASVDAAHAVPTSASPKCRVEVSQEAASAGACGFDVARRSFAGVPRVQAACLLRHVGRGGVVGASDLTPLLGRLVGRATTPGSRQLQRFLAVRDIDPAVELGGPLTPGLMAVYFVIHDTSSPNCSAPAAPGCEMLGALPTDMNVERWSDNARFNGFAADPRSLKAHVITNRVGGSLTAHDLSEHVSHVRFDFCFDAPAKRNLFVGVENIQPRIGSPARPGPGEPVNDLIAPVPGFTDTQYERLALIYIAASTRHGRWLIPAYHAVLDRLYDPPTAHDDPQNFNLAAFSAKIETLLIAIRRP